MPRDWDNVHITLKRPRPPNPDGPCAGAPEIEHFDVSLPFYQRHVTLYPYVCLEPDEVYKIRVDLKQYQSGVENPSASLLVDSVS